MNSPLEFEALFREEQALLSKETLDTLKCERPEATDEPWISYTPVDRVGLAFSGGGIRSATFNLGILKALHELGVLKHVDYLSTVSGGGYIGAWWSAWRARRSDGREFPAARHESDDRKLDEKLNREPDEIRHLREFSNFLSPRIGFFQSETWNAIMAVLSAMVPAVLVASSVIALALLVWLALNSLILADALSPGGKDWLKSVLQAAPLLLVIGTILMYVLCEVQWHRAQKAEETANKWKMQLFRVLMSMLIAVGILGAWPSVMHLPWMQARPPQDVSWWEWGTGIQRKSWPFSFSAHLFDAPILWAGVALVVFLPRLLVMRFVRVSRSGKIVSAIDRALSRLLSAAVIFAVLGLLWVAGCWLNYYDWGTHVPAEGAMVSGGAFALLRNWIGRLGPAKKGGIMDVLKPLLPQILAYVAIALWSVCIAALLARWLRAAPICVWVLIFAVPLAIILFAAVAFDPAQVSMHSFYRNRLARAYLGASNPNARQSAVENRQTDVRLRDDIQLRDLSPVGARRPIHLVCCAANDLGGDHLANLSRGSRSAVLSKFGFAIGNLCRTWDNEAGEERETLGLASAITASAAAFNSNMGSLSMTLGAGVTFLCSALNLRLGLWLPHPLTKRGGAPKIFPGMLFLKEMFGMTTTGLCPSTGSTPPKPVASYVHLSDGGHFENLALYELIRRHCRYIIVSDCGADDEVAFDDFGNAVRRIREDFGVEIEIDLTPLKPNDARLSKQHIAVGTITYDPRGDQKDTGVLLYLKPSLTGDEPSDITQYRTRNQNFPHESTGDQFYDEAQWESYRRLGEHAARSAFRFVEHERSRENLSADTIFNAARWEWYQSPEGLREKFFESTSRFTALEAEIRDKAPENFIREMFPELQFIDKKPGSDKSMTSEEMSSVLHFLIQIIQLMEDAWVGCNLETHWNDPINLGWMNAFQRWAYTPSFRLWWPILKPMFGSKFRRFIEERLNLADEDYPPTHADVNLHGHDTPDGVAKVYWTRITGPVPEDKTVYSFDLKLTFQRQQLPDITHSVQAGLAFLDLSAKPTARWTNEDFFVPPSLWGAGLGAIFLAKLLTELKTQGFKRFEVTIQRPNTRVGIDWLKRTDLASRQQRADLFAFYQRAGFNLDADQARFVLEVR